MAEESDSVVRVSTLELFFDLVFVFTITQLTSVLSHEPTFRGVVRVVLMLGLIWWMYGGYAWLTNLVAPDRGERRVILLGGMAAFLMLSLSIPRAFGDGGPAFGIAYAFVVLVHLGLFSKATEARTVRAVAGLAPFNLVTAALVVIGGIAGGTAQYVLWVVAALGEWITPRFVAGAFVISPGHFVERHGLVILIAIGESVVAVGAGAQALALDWELAGVAVLGLALSAVLWWAYFGGDDERAELALAGAPAQARSHMAINAFGYCHIGLLLGIVALAAAQKHVIADAGHALSGAFAILLGGGMALYLASDVAFRRSLGIGHGRARPSAVPIALATIPLGLVAAAAQLAAIVVVVGAVLVSERRREGVLT